MMKKLKIEIGGTGESLNTRSMVCLIFFDTPSLFSLKKKKSNWKVLTNGFGVRGLALT
jgi:hypothetical protein